MSFSQSPSGLPVPNSTHSFWHSQPSSLLKGHRSTRNVPDEADVVIIGSGISGTSAAWHLLSPDVPDEIEQPAGLSVVMLEAREACWGATGRNGGHCQPILFEHPNDPSIGNFELANLDDVRSTIERLKVPCEFVVQPGCRAVYTQRHVDEIETAFRLIDKLAPEQRKRMTLVTDKSELAKLRVPTAKAAVVTDVAARLWPYKLVAFLLERLVSSHTLRNHGSFNLQTLTPAEALSRHPDGQRWTVKTPRGNITAKKVILATNAYTSHLIPSFSNLIIPCRGQMSALTPLSTISDSHRLKTSLGFLGDGTDDYLIQRPNETGGHLMFGGGEHEGAHALGVTDDSVIDENVARYLRTRLISALALTDPDAAKERGLVSALLHPLPTELKAVAQWTGIMGMSRDEHPWVGPVPHDRAPGPENGAASHLPHWKRQPDSGLFVAAGYSGHGMPNTWLCGKAVGLMAAGSLRDGEEDAERVLREACEKTVLPKCYLVTDERIRRALDLEAVEARNLAHRRVRLEKQ